jgi:hypothetical protein
MKAIHDLAALWRMARRALLALAALFAFSPLSAAADKVWAPTPEEQRTVGSSLDALSVLQKLLQAGEVNLCAFVGDHSRREQVSATATGRVVTIGCGAANEQYVIDYATHSAFGLDAMSSNDRIMFCESRNGAAIYAIYDKYRDGQVSDKMVSDSISCLESSATNGRYKREVVRRFATAWTMLSRHWAVKQPDEATLREGAKNEPPLTADQQESLRRTQIQVELAIKENRLLDAAKLYRASLVTTPAWPGGQFNYALVMADLEFYPGAVWAMRTYLALSPDAPDARAARDKMYEWEAKLPRPAQ